MKSVRPIILVVTTKKLILKWFRLFAIFSKNSLLKNLQEIDKYRDLITFVKDRPGHDARYAIDASKIERELGWVPEETFETGLRKTVQWYLDNTGVVGESAVGRLSIRETGRVI